MSSRKSGPRRLQFRFGAVSVGHRRADDEFVLGGVPVQVCLEGCEQRHEHRRAFRLTEGLEAAHELMAAVRARMPGGVRGVRSVMISHYPDFG